MRANLEDNLARRVRHSSALFSTVQTVLTGAYTIPKDGPQFHYLDPNGASRNVRLPPIEPGGGQFYIIANIGTSGTLQIIDFNGVSVGAAGTNVVQFCVSSKQRWFVTPMGASVVASGGAFFVFNDPVNGLVATPITGQYLPAAKFLELGAVKAKAQIVGQVLAFLDESGAFGTLQVREQVTANREYFVRKDGNDSNNGLVDSAGGAFLTIQKAIDVVAALDWGIFSPIISIGAGTYNTGTGGDAVIGLRSITGDLAVLRKNPTAAVGSVIINANAATGITASNVRGRWTIDGLKVQIVPATGGFNCIIVNNSQVNLANMEFGTTGSAHVFASANGQVVFTTNYAVSGGGPLHWFCSNNATFICGGRTVTITGTPQFSNAFCYCDNSAIMQVNANTFTGAVAAGTKKFVVNTNGTIATLSGSLNYFPGDIAGTVDGVAPGAVPFAGAAGGIYT